MYVCTSNVFQQLPQWSVVGTMWFWSMIDTPECFYDYGTEDRTSKVSYVHAYDVRMYRKSPFFCVWKHSRYSLCSVVRFANKSFTFLHMLFYVAYIAILFHSENIRGTWKSAKNANFSRTRKKGDLQYMAEHELKMGFTVLCIVWFFMLLFILMAFLAFRSAVIL